MKLGAAVLLDTSGWFAALNPREARHQAASAAYRGLLERRVPLLTTNLIVAEMHVLLTRARGPETGLAFLDALYADPTHEVVHVDRDLELDAVDSWIRGRTDVRLSLADATAFELVRARGIEQTLSLDSHFRTAGLRLIPD